MERVTFINARGQSVELGNDAPYILTKVEGTGAVSTNIQRQKSPFQDGETYLGNTMEARSIPIEIMLLGEDIEDMAEKRNELLQVFNPKLGQGTLVYEFGNVKREITAISELSPIFPHAGDFKDTMQQGLIQLYCPDPFFRDLAEEKEEVAIWRAAFEFPLEIPMDEGIEFGFREPSLIANIENAGDIECGIRVEFKALGTVVNPSLFNVDTREYIKINKTMIAGEILTVTTHFQNKRVDLNKNGIASNAFNWIDLDSTFLQLSVGDNLLRYDADEGLDNLEVDIYYTQQYLGV